MSMSGIRQCGRCGGAITIDGKCSACGTTSESLDVLPSQYKESQGTSPSKSSELFSFSTTGKKEMRASRPAFLLNETTNDRYLLTQSVSKIGRDQTNNISLASDHYISRHHAWVLQMQGGFWVEDLGSTNGTLLNGEILNERKQIFPGDRLTFGKTELVFLVE